MIDTTCIYIDFASLNVVKAKIKENMFNRSFESFGSNWHRWDKTAPDKPNIYLPHIELVHYTDYADRENWRLKIRFSAPKLIFSNNLFELQDKDFKLVCQKLQETLETMGISLTLTEIEEAEVLELHIGKNIFTKGIKVNAFLKYLFQVPPANNKMDVQKTAFRNGNQLTFHNKNKELCLYDKYQEMSAFKKQQKNIIDTLDKQGLKDILRIELRLSNKAEIQKAFGKKILSFKEIFNCLKLFAILNKDWKKLYKSYTEVPFIEFGPEYLYKTYKRKNRNEINTLALIGLESLRRSNGYNATRKLLESKEAKKLLAKLKNQALLDIDTEYDLVGLLNIEIAKCEIITKASLTKNRPYLSKNMPLLFEPFLKVKEAAKYIKVKERTLQNWLKKGKIKHFRFGTKYRLRKSDIFEYLAKSYTSKRH